MLTRIEQGLRQRLRAVRAIPPLNAMATFSVRAAMRLLGMRSTSIEMHLIRHGEVTFRLPDQQRLKLWSKGDDGISNAVFWNGWMGSERATAPVFYRLARRARTTLDIGAYVGYYALIAAAANANARVYAFEPLEPIRNRLDKHVRINHLTNVHVIGKAVGVACGSATFYHTDAERLPTSSSLSSSFMSAAVRQGLLATTVEVVAIDDFVADNRLENVDLVKIDTETTEADVIRGMRRTIERHRPDIICEVLPFKDTSSTVEQLLKPLGYQFYQLRDDGPVKHETLQPDLKALNYLCSVRADAATDFNG
jgi:FkbM family methyltransferase